jgi:hypothetical protein
MTECLAFDCDNVASALVICERVRRAQEHMSLHIIDWTTAHDAESKYVDVRAHRNNDLPGH